MPYIVDITSSVSCLGVAVLFASFVMRFCVMTPRDENWQLLSFFVSLLIVIIGGKTLSLM